LTELSSALLGLVGDVPGVAVDGVVPLSFHWPELVEPDVLEPDVVEPEVPEFMELLPDVAPAPVAELSLAPLLESVPVVLQAARPKHRDAARIALVMVMMHSFFVSEWVTRALMLASDGAGPRFVTL
jgi:hypothetical protein